MIPGESEGDRLSGLVLQELTTHHFLGVARCNGMQSIALKLQYEKRDKFA